MPGSSPGNRPRRGRSGAGLRPGRDGATGRGGHRHEEEPALGTVTELSHTADVGFELRAARLEGLFEAAADGLARARGASADPDGRAGAEDVTLSRPDLDRLLVAWLRELLYRAMRDDVVPEAVVEEVSGPGDSAGADGQPASPADRGARLRARVVWRPAADEPVREIKGVTYHGLEVRREEDGDWHARVVLDV